MTETLDLTQFDGKKVIVQHQDGEGNVVETEGTVQTGNELGLLIKPKGKASVEIIEAATIEGVELAPEKAKKVGVKWLKDVELGQARQHLLDRHGATVTEVNALNEQQAFEAHADIDHEAEDLGHRHGEKPKKSESEPETSDDEE